MRRRLNITSSFLDIMFNILLGFFVLLMISIVLINPVKKNKNIELKAEIMITLEWDDGSEDDIDLFVKSPTGEIVYYGGKDIQGISLDRDDLGTKNDRMVMSDGTVHIIQQNWEHVAVRKSLPGEYIVNSYTYSKRDVGATNLKIKVEKLNPYQLIYAGATITTFDNEELTHIRFTLDSSGRVVDKSRIEESLKNRIRR